VTAAVNESGTTRADAPEAGVEGAAMMLSVVRGEPTAEELAALVAVIASRGGAGSGAAAAPKVSGWTDRARYVRGRLPHSPDGWRASALPR
jgi:hypothetical protein